MDKVYVFLADGFEEIEGLTVVDVLRRGQVDVETVSISDRLEVTGSHGITVKADIGFDQITEEGTYYVLPGGMPGTLHLKAHEGLTELLRRKLEEGKHLAAICAAPSVFGELGLLQGKIATCYPGFEEKLAGAQTTTNEVEISGLITTSRGMGTAIPFALSLLGQIKGEDVAKKCADSIIYRAS